MTNSLLDFVSSLSLTPLGRCVSKACGVLNPGHVGVWKGAKGNGFPQRWCQAKAPGRQISWPGSCCSSTLTSQSPLVSSPFLSQASTAHLPAFLSFFLFCLVFSAFLGFSLSLPLFLCVLTFLSPFRSLCSFPSVFTLSWYCSRYFRFFICWQVLASPREANLYLGIIFNLKWLFMAQYMQVLGWFKSRDCNWTEPTSPYSYSLWKKPHNSIQRLFNKHCNPVPHPVLIFPTFFSLAVFTPVLLYDYTRNDVVFIFLCSLNQQQVCILLSSLYAVNHQYMSAFVVHILVAA